MFNWTAVDISGWNIYQTKVKLAISEKSNKIFCLVPAGIPFEIDKNK